MFEFQIKTFLQHAWGIATHDLIYKPDLVSWGTSRVAFQVKAMLENAELSISEARKLTDSTLLDRADNQTLATGATIKNLKTRWTDPDTLPRNLARLAENIQNLARIFRIEVSALWGALDSATAAGRGAALINVSPYAAVLESLIAARGASLFEPLAHRNNRNYLFVPEEVALPPLSPQISNWIVSPAPRPPSADTVAPA
jgi:hypothetical protein